MEQNLNELTQKIKYLDDQLKSDLFSNPIREIQENLRNQLLDFSETFNKNLTEAEEFISKLEEKKQPQLETNQIPQDDLVSKKLLDKKEYQVEILKKAFVDYEKKTLPQIEKLNLENNKLKYRIGILLDTINKLEKNKREVQK